MNENNIPIIEPTWGTAIEFDTKNRITKIDLDWEDFYKMDREKQINELEYILRSLKDIPITRKEWHPCFPSKGIGCIPPRTKLGGKE